MAGGTAVADARPARGRSPVPAPERRLGARRQAVPGPLRAVTSRAEPRRPGRQHAARATGAIPRARRPASALDHAGVTRRAARGAAPGQLGRGSRRRGAPHRRGQRGVRDPAAQGPARVHRRVRARDVVALRAGPAGGGRRTHHRSGHGHVPAALRGGDVPGRRLPAAVLLPEFIVRIGDVTPPGVQSLLDAWSGTAPDPLALAVMAATTVVAGWTAARSFRWE